MQIRIQELINKEVVPLRDVSSLDNYLQTLRERAIDQRDVTALEVETGIQAIQNLGTELGPEETQKREEQFTSEMEELSRQLGKVPQPREKISVEEAEQMIEVLSAETEPVRKSEIIREILNNIETIEDPEQEEKILKKLDFVIVNSENTKSSQNINEILDIIENASNAESRDVAVSAYVEAVSSLDEPDYGEAIEKLDRLLKK
jgi:carboxypeptidase C (cathepsin A)